MSENGLSSLKSSIDARLGLSSRAQHFVIASAVLCHRECSALSSRVQHFVIANGAQCALWVWRSQLFRAGKQIKARLLRRLSCHREERSDFAFHMLANRQKRDCFTGSPLSVIARNEAISPFHCQQTDKREIASQARNDSNIVSSRA